jgi:hypothetical protein
MKIPGEYDGSESHLPHDIYPAARLQTTAAFRTYLKNKVKIVIDGVDQAEGLVAEVTDEATGVTDEAITRSNLLTIRGWGLKIDGTEENQEKIGLFFMPTESGEVVKAQIIAVNEPRTLKVIVPPELVDGRQYFLRIVTQTSAKSGSVILKNTRELRSEGAFTVMTP